MSHSVRADSVSLRNGDTLTGTVASLQDGKLIFQSLFGGPLTIPWTEVQSLSTDSPVTLVVGDHMLEAHIVRREAGGLFVRAADGSEERLPDADLRAINPPLPALPPPPPSAWTGTVELGGKTTGGNKDTQGVTAAGGAVWKGEANVVTMKSLFRYSEVDQDITERSTYASGKYDIGLGRSPYLFLAEEILADKFKDLRIRTISSAGLGYTLVQAAVVTASIDAGYAWQSEHFFLAEDQGTSSLRLGGALKIKISEIVTLEDAFQGYSSLERSKDYTGRNEASLVLQLAARWGLRIGTILEYDSRPPSKDIERLDVTHMMGIQYRF